jgi:hypothetical protein
LNEFNETHIVAGMYKPQERACEQSAIGRPMTRARAHHAQTIHTPLGTNMHSDAQRTYPKRRKRVGSAERWIQQLVHSSRVHSAV